VTATLCCSRQQPASTKWCAFCSTCWTADNKHPTKERTPNLGGKHGPDFFEIAMGAF
jgi:hypothetical protein